MPSYKKLDPEDDEYEPTIKSYNHQKVDGYKESDRLLGNKAIAIASVLEAITLLEVLEQFFCFWSDRTPSM
jgi:hypothetical protein